MDRSVPSSVVDPGVLAPEKLRECGFMRRLFASAVAVALLSVGGCSGSPAGPDGGSAGGSAGGLAGGSAGGLAGGSAGGLAGGSAGGLAGGSAGGVAGGCPDTRFEPNDTSGQAAPAPA